MANIRHRLIPQEAAAARRQRLRIAGTLGFAIAIAGAAGMLTIGKSGVANVVFYTAAVVGMAILAVSFLLYNRQH